VVVVGTGFGCRVHVPALRAAGFDVVALVGNDEARTARRAARYGVPRSTTVLADALALPGVEAVTIATPPSTHAALAIEVVRASKHVLCEKPFALNAREAAAMFAAADQAGVGHLVGHEFRWAPERAAIGRAIAAGRIGEPRLASLVSMVGLVADPDTRLAGWWFDVAQGGGWLGASGSHLVDQVRSWLGDFESVSAALSVVSARTAVADDTFTVRFRLRSGVEGVMQQTAAGWGPMLGITAVAGSDGTLWINGDRAWIADRDGARPLEVPDDPVATGPASESDDPRHRFTHLELGPYTKLCGALRAAVAGTPYTDGADAVAVPTFADGLAEMQVLDSVRASAKAGGALVDVARAASEMG
jgi:predicted dehydrogenase